MDDLFKIRVLTAAVNAMTAPSMVIYNRIFRGKEHLEPSDRLAFEIHTGSQKILKNLSVYAPAQVRDKTGRKVVTLEAPRLAQKRLIHTAELNALRAYGSQVQAELMSTRIAREQRDMRNEIDRTMEFWAANALRGKIYDADLSTVLVDYGLDATHLVTLTNTNLWTHADSKPLNRIRAFKKTIEDDALTAITGWIAFLGSEVMDALLAHSSVLDFLKYDKGSQMAASGRIERLAEVELTEYNGSFLDDSNTRRRFIDEKYMLLVGLCDDLVDVPYAPIVDDEAPGGVGNIDENGNGVLFFSKSWKVPDPSGRWVKVESRPLPVLQRPGAVIYAKVV
ncbi:major capsid protein [Desulfatiglans anilini]|uniref:major capsid protein n=1 Tax=Desulfatiglans anilini TaxID=90728 RepID=UPI0003F858D0|nr:major capsid protein [Desulfatiglans anilini]